MAKKPALNMTRVIQGIRARRLLAEPTSMPHLAVTNAMFMNTAFKPMPNGEAAMTCAFDGDPFNDEGDRQYKWRACPWRPGVFIGGGQALNRYVCISTFRPDPETGRWRRLKGLFERMRALMIDDIETKVPMSRIVLPLSAMVETSPSNYQGWYFLEPSAASRDYETASAVIKAMIASGLTADGSDPGMAGVTRYGRLPMGINGKQKYVEQLGHPFQCGAVSWNPERRYRLQEIIKAYDLDLEKHNTRPGRYGGASGRLPRGEATKRVLEFERMMRTLAEHGLYQVERRDWHDIVCPWSDEHTDQKIGGTALCVPAASNSWLGGFKCHHGHCAHRTIGDVYKLVHGLRRGGER